MLYALGLGYNSKAAQNFAAAELARLIKMQAEYYHIACIHTVCAPQKAEMPAFLPALAENLQAKLLLCAKTELKMQAEFCLSFSPRSLALYGCGSVAEAAALCGAQALAADNACINGNNAGIARLLAPKVNCGAVSFAFAAAGIE